MSRLTSACLAAGLISASLSGAVMAADEGKDLQTNLAKLTVREKEVFRLLLQGCTLKETAGCLSIGYSTVNTHMTSIYRKLKVCTRAQLIILYQHCGKENPT